MNALRVWMISFARLRCASVDPCGFLRGTLQFLLFM